VVNGKSKKRGNVLLFSHFPFIFYSKLKNRNDISSHKNSNRAFCMDGSSTTDFPKENKEKSPVQAIYDSSLHYRRDTYYCFGRSRFSAPVD
jgi:hypothetical protein